MTVVVDTKNVLSNYRQWTVRFYLENKVHVVTEKLTAETANSSPREAQLITRATTPNKHTLGK